MVSFLFGLICAGPAGYFIRKSMKHNSKEILNFKLYKNHQTPKEAVKVITDMVKIMEK